MEYGDNGGMGWLLAAWIAALLLYGGYALWVLRRRGAATAEAARLGLRPTSRP